MTLSTPIKDVQVPPPKKPGLAIQHTEPGVPKRLTVLAYGAPGSGKTYFAGTFPKPLFIDLDQGLMTVRAKRVAYIRPTNWLDLRTCITPEYIKDFNTIVVDTLTEAHVLILAEIFAGSGKDALRIQDWGQASERIVQLVKGLRSLEDKHVVCLCDERTDKDEETGKIMVGPALPGQLFNTIGRYFDCVFHLRNANKDGKRQRVILTEPEGLYQGKDRIGGLEKFETPDFNVIWTKVTKLTGQLRPTVSNSTKEA